MPESADFEVLKKRIEKAGQAHLLRYWPELSEDEKNAYFKQLSSIDFETLPSLVENYVLRKPEMRIPADLAPAPYFPLVPDTPGLAEKYQRAEQYGKQLVRDGKVACLTVAGGQGTRLGFNGPKGTYPICPVSGNSLFSCFAGAVARMGEKYGRRVTWYIMTSLLNRAETEKFFSDNNFFGLEPDQIFFFTQGTMPACGYDGKLLMSGKGSLALSPDGHGGTLLALYRSGALRKMREDGVEYISYFQVDNPLVPVISPLFLGMHALEKSEMSAIMLAKTGPYEKLGNFCITGGKLEVIEYSDLPSELAESKNADGTLRFIAGSPAIHIISRDFVEKLTEGGSLKLPWHRADKKIAFINGQGEPVTPDSPNGVKLESFIFDALPLARHTMVLEGERRDVFAPTKNATGVDSAESCRMMMMDRDSRRLAAAGVEIPRRRDGGWDAMIEISPRCAVDAEDVADYVLSHNLRTVAAGEKLYLN